MHKHLQTAFDIINVNKYEQHMDYHLAAMIVSGGKIISQGWNNSQTNGFVEHYTNRIRGPREYCLSTHAEMSCILKARNKVDLRGSKIYVARRRKDDGNPGMARPCAICEEVLRAYGVKRAVYTIDENQYGIMSIYSRGHDDRIVRI